MMIAKRIVAGRGRYVTAVMGLVTAGIAPVDGDGGPWDHVMSAAAECDRMAKELTDDAQRAADMYARWTPDSTSTPDAYSSVREFPALAAVFRARVASLVTLVTALGGEEVREIFRDLCRAEAGS